MALNPQSLVMRMSSILLVERRCFSHGAIIPMVILAFGLYLLKQFQNFPLSSFYLGFSVSEFYVLIYFIFDWNYHLVVFQRRIVFTCFPLNNALFAFFFPLLSSLNILLNLFLNKNPVCFTNLSSFRKVLIQPQSLKLYMYCSLWLCNVTII